MNSKTIKDALGKVAPLIALIILFIILSFLTDKFFTVNNMSIYVASEHYVTKTYDVPLKNYVPHEFINPGFKCRYNVEWKAEQGNNDGDDDDDDDDGGDGDDDVF